VSEAFARPELWPCLALLPAAWLAAEASTWLARRRLLAAVGPRARDLTPWQKWPMLRLRAAAVGVAVGLLALALMQPIAAREGEALEREGVDVVIALDVSRSMLARDSGGSRLDRARQDLLALAPRLRGDRVALVEFAGDARVTLPLSRHRESFAALVAAAGPEGSRRGGTDLANALRAVHSLLERRGATATRNAAVVLLSDGEDLAGRGLAAARELAAHGVEIHCVAYGSATGSKIALDGDAGGRYLRDRAGVEVITRADPSGLAAIAAAGGGEFHESPGGGEPVLGLFDRRVAPRGEQATAAAGSSRPLFQWPLLAAFALLVLRIGLPPRMPGAPR
jgi:Ca-activated chloride channel family protein